MEEPEEIDVDTPENEREEQATFAEGPFFSMKYFNWFNVFFN
jgi:hypothetical protein